MQKWKSMVTAHLHTHIYTPTLWGQLEFKVSVRKVTFSYVHDYSIFLSISTIPAQSCNPMKLYISVTRLGALLGWRDRVLHVDHCCLGSFRLIGYFIQHPVHVVQVPVHLWLVLVKVVGYSTCGGAVRALWGTEETRPKAMGPTYIYI